MRVDDPALLLTLSVNSLLRGGAGFDVVNQAWRALREHPPLVTRDDVFGSAADGASPVAFLVGALRSAGVTDARLVPLSLAGLAQLPKLPRPQARLVGGGPAVVLQREGVAAGVARIDAGGESLEVYACAPVRHTPLAAVTVGEARRELRESVMSALAALESNSDRAWQLREWQEESLTPVLGGEVPLELDELFASADHRSLLATALDLDEAMNHSLVSPLTRLPGDPLARVANAAAAALSVAAGVDTAGR